MKTTVGEYIYSVEVRQARAKGAPVVALESTLITHGLPYPVNVETARALEQEVRAAGAVPATIALLACPDNLARKLHLLGPLQWAF